MASASGGPYKRLLLCYNKIRSINAIQNALLPSVCLVVYKYDSCSLNELLAQVSEALAGCQVESIACIFYSSMNAIWVTSKEDKLQITDRDFHQFASLPVTSFLKKLCDNNLDKHCSARRLDLLGCCLRVDGGNDSPELASELTNALGIPVNVSRDVCGSDILLVPIGVANGGSSVDAASSSSAHGTVASQYFRVEKLRGFQSGNSGAVDKRTGLAGFERIRTVGKGAFGTAVLYRKKDDDSLVVLKEINMHDLNAQERQMALNEVKMLSMFDHPNIIGYYDSFEEDGVLLIEMEYADGGTLDQYLNRTEKPLDEYELLVLFQQIVSAISYIHERKVLHRDLKTANILLTTDRIVKVGDFGISKMLSTGVRDANTVLGTPFYISPEICEGKEYNEKSDVWALGCILYEMACLQRTFEGSNLPAVVNKIMKGQFAPVRGNYSEEFKTLISRMLQRDPTARPTSSEVLNKYVVELLSRFSRPTNPEDDDDKNAKSQDAATAHLDQKNASRKSVRSVVYYYDTSTLILTAIDLPPRIRVRFLAAGPDHVIIYSEDQCVYTFGDGSKGQLGQGNYETKTRPEPVESLRGKSLKAACCGDGFSIFLSENGLLMTCGDGQYGCLGHSDWSSVTKPKLIESLLSVDIVRVACGTRHVVAVSRDGRVFAWGCGTGGRTGLGDEEARCEPTQVTFGDKSINVRNVFCGIDGTMLLTDTGSLYAAGSNKHNKLGLNQRQGFLMAMKNIFSKIDVEGSVTFTCVKALARFKAIEVSLGMHHTAVLVEPHHIITFGRNSEGQLGTGNTRPQHGLFELRSLQDRKIQRVHCGHYGTATNTSSVLYFWGSRFSRPPSGAVASGTQQKASLADTLTTVNVDQKPHRLHTRTLSGGATLYFSGGFRPLGARFTSHLRKPKGNLSLVSSGVGLNDDEVDDEDDDREPLIDTEFILQPQPLFRVDSNASSGEEVTIVDFIPHGNNMLIHVETTAPPPKARRVRNRVQQSPRRSTTSTMLSVRSRQSSAASSSDASTLPSRSTTRPSTGYSTATRERDSAVASPNSEYEYVYVGDDEYDDTDTTTDEGGSQGRHGRSVGSSRATTARTTTTVSSAGSSSLSTSLSTTMQRMNSANQFVGLDDDSTDGVATWLRDEWDAETKGLPLATLAQASNDQQLNSRVAVVNVQPAGAGDSPKKSVTTPTTEKAAPSDNRDQARAEERPQTAGNEKLFVRKMKVSQLFGSYETQNIKNILPPAPSVMPEPERPHSSKHRHRHRSSSRHRSKSDKEDSSRHRRSHTNQSQPERVSSANAPQPVHSGPDGLPPRPVASILKQPGGKSVPPSALPGNRQLQINAEIEAMRTERERNETLLLRLQNEYQEHLENVKRQSREEARRREVQLQREIEQLKLELRKQNKSLQSHYHLVKDLQNQLQDKTQRSSQNEPPQVRAAPSSASKESRICIVQ